MLAAPDNDHSGPAPMPSKIVLAYSGGLDTSVAVPWLKENADAEIVCVAVDVGQDAPWDQLEDRARRAGASDVRIVDARAEFARDYCFPALRAGALYEGRYPLVSALSRPLIAQKLVAAARETGAAALAHGCTGKGNDQVRFEVALGALAPDLDIVAPVRGWGMNRADCLEYAQARGILVSATRERPYSIDDNLWGRAIEAGEMEDTWAAPPDDIWEMTRRVAQGREELTLAFEAGIPVAIDGEAMAPHVLVDALNARVGRYGWGRIDMVENRRVGIKSRECYEAPGAMALYAARRELESLCLERDLDRFRQEAAHRYANLVYDGLWFSPLREALDAFVAESDRPITGEVRLRLEPGSLITVGRRSPNSLYDSGLATYDAGDRFRHADSEGFVRLWGLSAEVWSRSQGPAAGEGS